MNPPALWPPISAHGQQAVPVLTICAWCNRIKDDQGEWAQAKQIATEGVGGKATHGICPECRIQLLAEMPLAADRARHSPVGTPFPCSFHRGDPWLRIADCRA